MPGEHSDFRTSSFLGKPTQDTNMAPHWPVIPIIDTWRSRTLAPRSDRPPKTKPCVAIPRSRDGNEREGCAGHKRKKSNWSATIRSTKVGFEMNFGWFWEGVSQVSSNSLIIPHWAHSEHSTNLCKIWWSHVFSGSVDHVGKILLTPMVMPLWQRSYSPSFCLSTGH